jgi:hypothetical protein
LKEAKLHKGKVRRLKAHLTLATADMQAAKVMMRNPDALDLDRLRCHVIHIMDSGGEILKLLDPDQSQHHETFEDERPIILDLDDPESVVTGRITIDPTKVPTNGAGKEVQEED